MPTANKILIADDNQANRELLEAYLASVQCDTEIAVDGQDTLEKVKSFQPDLILLDIMMPRLPGGNVAAQIDADPDLKGTPIVFLTAAVRKWQVEDNDGIICEHPCLAKPASIDEVVDIIEKYARK